MDEKLAASRGSQESAARTTNIDVDVTAGAVQDAGRVTGVEIGVIHGPVTINVAPAAVDLDAIRRAATAAFRAPVLTPMRSFEPETILIPAGPFLMGSADPAAPAAERPQHTVHLPDFRIGKYPVKVREYAAFIKDVKAQPAPPGWFNREPPAGQGDHPVVNVSWHDALAYCAWLSEQTGRRYTLPSEAEWEKAATWAGEQGSGGAEGQRSGGAGEQGSRGAGEQGGGASAYGVEELLGNVQQWTRSLWGTQPGQPDYGYPYDPADGREVMDPAKLPAQARLVHRGGSFKSAPADLRVTARGNALPDSKIAWRGFRVATAVE